MRRLRESTSWRVLTRILGAAIALLVLLFVATFFTLRPSHHPALLYGIPVFDLPPPQPSDHVDLPRSFFADAGTLGAVATVLAGALSAEQYRQPTYYAVPGNGFAMATNIERIHADGASFSGTKRWDVVMKPPPVWKLEYLRSLFTKDLPPGHFRVFIFVVTTMIFDSTSDKVTRDQASAWRPRGANRLPAALANLPFDDRYAVTALVYEFEYPPGADKVIVKRPGALKAEAHLKAARLWADWSSRQ